MEKFPILSKPVKRIRIIQNAPKENGCGSLYELIGQEFDVLEVDEAPKAGVYIPWGGTGYYFIFEGEFEYVDS